MSRSACSRGILTYKFCNSPRRLKVGGSGVLVKAKCSGNGGFAVSATLLEDDCTSSGTSCSFVCSLSEEVTSAMVGYTILPDHK
jgi:hypothetical protein